MLLTVYLSIYFIQMVNNVVLASTFWVKNQFSFYWMLTYSRVISPFVYIYTTFKRNTPLFLQNEYYILSLNTVTIIK